MAKKSIAERFWPKVDKSGGPDACWLWTAHRNHRGYGVFAIDKKCVLAHRVVMLLAGRTIGASRFVLHHCDNPRCVNPRHLFIGTHQDNMLDKESKGRGNHPSGSCHGSRTKPESVRFGSRHHKAKLCEADVVNIRRMCASGKDRRDIASAHGISLETVSNIFTRYTWKHVA